MIEKKMSGKFDGFTREDIHKITSKSNSTVKLGGRGIRRMPERKVAQNNIKNKVNIECPPSKDPPILIQNNDESMTSLQEALHFRPLSMKTMDKQNSDDNYIEIAESIPHIENAESKSNNDSSILSDPNSGDSPSPSPFKGISLKDFESHRKMIEEQNRQKKELLYKAIEQHSQKTAAESKRIEEIKSELAKLDNDLAADVSILRQQIEAACIQYANIEKNYNKIESQFLKAKLDLHNASEKKELLTEHLCTVITHNEDRKARKLSELMEKVGLTPAGNLAETDVNSPILQ